MTTPKHDERDLNVAVRSWLHEGDEPMPDRNRQIGRIMGRVDETRQQRRLWPLNPFGRRAMHSATGTDRADAVSGRRTLAPVPALAFAAVAVLLLASALVWLATQPREVSNQPAASPIDPADRALFERLGSGTWKGADSDRDTALEVYAPDAVHTALGLDDSERFVGADAIWRRMWASEVVDASGRERVRLPDSEGGARRYFDYVPRAAGGIACVFWIEDEQVTRHDCILPMSSSGVDASTASDQAAPTISDVAPSAVAEREQLSSSLREALASRDALRLADLVAQDVVHHVQSDNQAYTLEGFAKWVTVMSGGGPVELADIDLPAPEGELRWANFSNVGDGSLCIFSARDGRIHRHDCVVPGYTTISLSLISDEPEGAAGDRSPQPGRGVQD